ncbi:MAG: winged helix-turn-helix transcriptional regulator [Methanomassiliicoccales archaeon]|jgi:DNA-binding Lrp family transcriptional regulator
MDELDITIIRRLLTDSRIPYSELAEGLGISVQATQKRVEAMVRSGVIVRFTAKLSLRVVGYANGIAFGHSNETDPGRISARLRSIDEVDAVMVSSGNVLHIILDIRSVDELESLRARLRDAAIMDDLSLAVIPCNRFPDGQHDTIKLRPLDLRIIHAMRNNSRLPLCEIADQVGVTAKTVSKSLDRLRREGLIRMSIDYKPDQARAIMSFVYIKMDGGHRPVPGHAYFFNACPNLVCTAPFSNLPDEMAYLMWSDTISDMRESLAQLAEGDSVSSVVPYVIHHYDHFPTWRDALLEDLVMNKSSFQVGI